MTPHINTLRHTPTYTKPPFTAAIFAVVDTRRSLRLRPLPDRLRYRPPDTGADPSDTMVHGVAASGAATSKRSSSGGKVSALVQSHPVVVFSKTYCGYCLQVKQLLRQLGVKAKVVELDDMADGVALQRSLAAATGQRTVPSVWIGGKHIGGNDKTQALHARGQLEPLIAAATSRTSTPVSRAGSGAGGAGAGTGAAPSKATTPASFVKDTVRGSPVVVFSKSSCPYCRRTKTLLRQLGVNASVVELDKRADGRAIQDALASLSGQRTVPNVFIGGEHIGGNDATQALHRSGKLAGKLAAAGVEISS